MKETEQTLEEKRRLAELIKDSEKQMNMIVKEIKGSYKEADRITDAWLFVSHYSPDQDTTPNQFVALAWYLGALSVTVDLFRPDINLKRTTRNFRQASLIARTLSQRKIAVRNRDIL